MKPSASNPKPLLWINHDAENRKARPHRRVVFSHVQGSWKKFKRQEDAIALRKSAMIPNTRTADISQPERIQSKDQITIEASSHKFLLASALIKGRQPFTDELTAVAGRIRPQTILGKGNSDPFQAFSIPIDARLVDLLAYSREMYLPKIFNHVGAPDVQAAVTGAFAETISFMHDECTAYPQIAKIAAVMPKGSVAPELASKIPAFKMKGLASLRTKLMIPESLLEAKTSAAMLLFLTAELYEGNLEAAATHARMIAHLLQTQTIPLNFLFLFSALYDDTQRACFALSRPAFDVKIWLPQQLGPLGVTIIEKVAHRIVLAACGPVDASIKSENLKSIIAEANRCSAIALLMSKEKDQTNTDNQITFRFGCRRFACIGTIINQYIDSREKMRQSKRKHATTVQSARMEAQICLALLYLMRREAKMDLFWIRNKFGVFSENRNILAGLQNLLRHDSLKFEGKYARARLFALFVGAWAAYANVRAGATYELVEREWFESEFAAQAVLMSLWSWKAVEDVLKDFHFLDLLQPEASIVWETLNPWDAQSTETLPEGE